MPDQDKMQQNDHDTLIRVEAKVDTLVAELKRVGDSLAIQLANHETRLANLELWHNNFKATWKFILGLASVTGAVAGLVIQGIIAWFSHK